jgi:inosine-uridine nucleoside N-ribohydrolase
MASKRQVIIDTDIGCDDAFAILLALRDPTIDVIAITCLSGNVHIDEVLKNARRLVDLVGKPEIPIYKGAIGPLLGEWHPPRYQGHGTDGLGDSNLPVSDIAIQPQHASIALSQLFDNHPVAYLITLGPMTNVALAVSLDRSLAKKVKPGHFWMMGGSHLSKGNAAYAAEFNIHSDPEAAEICFQRFPDITMVSWEQTLEADLSWLWYDEVIAIESNVYTKFLRAATKKYESITRQTSHHREFVMCDMVAMAAMLDPEMILDKQRLHVVVDTGSGHARGATIFDWYSLSKNATNVTIVLKMDIEKYRNFTKDIFLTK